MIYPIIFIAAIVLLMAVVYFVVSAKTSKRRKQYDRLARQIGGEVADSFSTETETVSINPDSHVFQNALPAGTISNLTTAEIDGDKIRIFDHLYKERRPYTDDGWQNVATTRVDLRSKKLDLPFFEIVRAAYNRVSTNPPNSIGFDERHLADEAFKVFESKNNSTWFTRQYQVFALNEAEIKQLFDKNVAAYFRDFEGNRGFEIKNVIGEKQELTIIADGNSIEPEKLLVACRRLAELLAKK